MSRSGRAAYDPGSGRDRRPLLEDAVDSEREASKLSARLRRAAAANATLGEPCGRIPYRYSWCAGSPHELSPPWRHIASRRTQQGTSMA